MLFIVIIIQNIIFRSIRSFINQNRDPYRNGQVWQSIFIRVITFPISYLTTTNALTFKKHTIQSFQNHIMERSYH